MSEDRRDIEARVDACRRHRCQSTSDDYCFTGCVACYDCNPAAHGGIRYSEYCRCGAERSVNENQCYVEKSEWTYPR